MTLSNFNRRNVEIMETISRRLTYYTKLKCNHCGKPYSPEEIQSYATCGEGNCARPLIAQYELPVGSSPSEVIVDRSDMWRYQRVMPLYDHSKLVTLGEGNTPLLQCGNLGAELDMPSLMIKDESGNPTGSFKARGLSSAISKANELGVEECVIPTAGNAGGAMAAYCAKAGIKATVVMPRFTPRIFQMECQYYGAELILIDGFLNDCGALAGKIAKERNCFNVSTMKEPFRLEGKKTMGYEIAEQLNWQVPDVILYPTGGGTGLLGIWKAFHEMRQMSWIEGKLPRMIAVQAENCQPIVSLMNGTREIGEPYQGSESIANGLVVPAAFAESMIKDVIITSHGLAMAVSDDDMMEGVKLLAKNEGLFVAPEGGALVSALKALLDNGAINREEQVLLLNTGTGYKYADNMN